MMQFLRILKKIIIFTKILKMKMNKLNKMKKTKKYLNKN
jgi:hypothetical protein